MIGEPFRLRCLLETCEWRIIDLLQTAKKSLSLPLDFFSWLSPWGLWTLFPDHDQITLDEVFLPLGTFSSTLESRSLSRSLSFPVCLPLVLPLRLPFIFSVSAEISMQPLVDIHNAYACASISSLEFVFHLVGRCLSHMESWRTSLFVMRIRWCKTWFWIHNQSWKCINISNWQILLFLYHDYFYSIIIMIVITFIIVVVIWLIQHSHYY